MQLLFLLVVIGAIGGVSEAVAGHAHRCLPPFGKRPFDDLEFSGDWYVVARGPLKNIPDVPTVCRQLHFTTEREGNETRVAIKFHIKEAAGGDRHPELKGRQWHGGPGSGSIMQAVWRSSPEDKWHGVIRLSVVATDYKTFAVILGCKEKYMEETDSFERFTVPEIWSRQPDINGETLHILKNVLTSFDVEFASITDMDNSGC